MLITGPEGPGFKTQLDHETLCLHPAVNGYLTLSRAGEGEGGEEATPAYWPMDNLLLYLHMTMRKRANCTEPRR